MKKKRILCHYIHFLILFILMIFPVDILGNIWNIYPIMLVIPYTILLRVGIILLDNYFNIRYMNNSKFFFLTLLLSFPVGKLSLFLPAYYLFESFPPTIFFVQNLIWMIIEMTITYLSYIKIKEMNKDSLSRLFCYSRNFLLVGFIPFYIYFGIVDITHTVIKDIKKGMIKMLSIELLFLFLLLEVIFYPSVIFWVNIENYVIFYYSFWDT